MCLIKKKGVFVFMFLFISILTVFSPLRMEASKPSVGKHGMVSSAHPIATESGLTILKKGGNAFDAAVAIGATLNVVEPMMSGMGGYGTILVYVAKKDKIIFLDSSGRIPASLNSDVFRSPTPDYLKNRRGPKAVSTPGNVNAWESMSKKFGLLKWPELFEAAIKVAENGFVLDKRTSRSIARSFGDFPEHAKDFYGKDGRPLKKGERLIQKDLADSLRKVAKQGARAVYGGKLGKAIDEEMRKTGGFLSLKDLINDQAEWWEPIHIRYGGYDVYTASPPSTAFPSLIRLGLMNQFEVSKLGHNTVDFIHRYCEVTKHAFWCRLKHAGDPEVSPPPLEILLSQKYWKEQTNAIHTKRAKSFTYPGKKETQDQHTTHFVVADKWGNVVCATQTLGNLFGSRIMPKDTGIWLNNSLAYCTFEPKGNPMDAHPGRRKLSGDCPTIIKRNGKPWVAIGTPGGHTIGQTVPQMVMNIVNFHMNIQEAIDAPKVSFVEPDIIVIEEGISREVIKRLQSMEHKIRLISKSRGLTNAHGLTIEYDKHGKPNRFTGGSDSRGQGLAKGF